MRSVYLMNERGQPHKSKGIQIISPGFDGQYGDGGIFNPDAPRGGIPASRSVEWDNITNFHYATLGGAGAPVVWSWRPFQKMVAILIVGFVYGVSASWLFGIQGRSFWILQAILVSINMIVILSIAGRAL